jgi:arabinosaccharide transport system substrate-binding protein
MFAFPYGKAALGILIAALSAGLWLACHPVPAPKATLTLWVTASFHYDAYRKALPAFEAAHPGTKVDVQLVAFDGMEARLQSAFWADLGVPDLVETEISSAGTLFRGPLNHVGLVDLTDRVRREGLWQRMIPARFAPYTSRGHIFGLPNDVCPVMLAYRRDILEREGVDVAQIKTWDDFIRLGHRLTVSNRRYMIELNDSGAENLEMCLFQRGGGYFDARGRCTLDNEIAVQTMRWYVPLVAGPQRIGSSLGGGQILTKAVEDGYFLFLVCPDWRTKYFEMDIPRVTGKMALTTLPAVYPGGIRTSSWGGTALAITRCCARQDLAWELAKYLYLDHRGLAEMFRGTNTLPVLPEVWNDPVFAEPRPYWSGQPIGALYARVAPQVPPQYASPLIVTAKAKLNEALVACAARYRAQGETGFEAFARERLHQSAEDVRRLIRRNPY